MSQNDFLGKVEYTWTDDLKGYFYNIYVKRANASNHMKPSDEIQPINTLNKMYIESMADFCNQNAATFLLVSTPSTVNWNSKKLHILRMVWISLFVVVRITANLDVGIRMFFRQ